MSIPAPYIQRLSPDGKIPCHHGMTDVETGNYIPWDEGVANYGYVKYLDHIKLLNEECAQRMSLGSALIRIATELASSQDKSLLAVLEEHGVKLEVE